MLSSVGQNNNVQRFSAVNALRTGANLLNKPVEEAQESVVEKTSDGTKSAPKGLFFKISLLDMHFLSSI